MNLDDMDEEKAGFLYVHIPYCLRKCAYCDFYSIPLSGEDVTAYVEALKREMLLRRGEIGTIRSVYIGGGTPTAIGEMHLLSLLDFAARNFSIRADAEITVEANPSTIDGPMLKTLAGGGVNRLSLGVQSLVDSELAALGRLHNGNDARIAMNRVGKHFDNYSVDLIYALPGQTTESWESTLREIAALAPPHVSAYELTPERGTPLGEAILSGRADIPSEDTVVSMYCLAVDFLEGKSYGHYEISNYALPGRECLHNLNYWQRGQYVGIGAAAHSFVDETRSANPGDVAGYRRALNSGKIGSAMEALEEALPVSRDITRIGETERIEEIVFLALRTSAGLSLKRLDKRFHKRLLAAGSPVIADMVEEGLIRFDGDRLSLTNKGMLLSNQVIVGIIRMLLPPLSEP
ncbi:MAG: radical SAM family heme chaperone HemW [Nitrospirae bacterium]|nr:radical SAM family heme chaperone HemW [Nitrospirota bacterium]